MCRAPPPPHTIVLVWGEVMAEVWAGVRFMPRLSVEFPFDLHCEKSKKKTRPKSRKWPEVKAGKTNKKAQKVNQIFQQRRKKLRHMKTSEKAK